MQYQGSCHCAAVSFTLEAPAHIVCYECNCSICSLTGYLHLVVPKSKFTLTHGSGTLTTYAFNTGVATYSRKDLIYIL